MAVPTQISQQIVVKIVFSRILTASQITTPGPYLLTLREIAWLLVHQNEISNTNLIKNVDKINTENDIVLFQKKQSKGEITDAFF